MAEEQVDCESSSAGQAAGRAIDLLRQQHVLYEELLGLAKKQPELISGEDPEMLLKVLATRQKLIDRLNHVGRELHPLRERWQEISLSLSPEQKGQLKRLTDSIRGVLSQILERDQEDSRRLQEQKQDVSDQLCTVQSGRQVNQAYGYTGSGPRSRYLDTTCE